MVKFHSMYYECCCFISRDDSLGWFHFFASWWSILSHIISMLCPFCLETILWTPYLCTCVPTRWWTLQRDQMAKQARAELSHQSDSYSSRTSHKFTYCVEQLHPPCPWSQQISHAHLSHMGNRVSWGSYDLEMMERPM